MKNSDEQRGAASVCREFERTEHQAGLVVGSSLCFFGLLYVAFFFWHLSGFCVALGVGWFELHGMRPSGGTVTETCHRGDTGAHQLGREERGRVKVPTQFQSMGFLLCIKTDTQQ